MKKIGLLLAILSFCTACTRLKTYLEVEKIQKNYFKKQAIQKEDSVFGKWNDINCLKADNDTLYLSCRPRYQAEDMYNPPMINVRVAPNKVITYLEISCDSMYNKQPYFTIVGYYGKYQKEGIWAYSKANKYRQGKTAMKIGFCFGCNGNLVFELLFYCVC